MFAYIDGPFPYHTVLLLSVVFGFLGGLLYECFRILRTAVATVSLPKRKAYAWIHKLIVFGEDLLFFLILGVAAVLFLFVFNRGQLRLSMPISMLLGFGLYCCTLGKLLFSLHSALLRFVCRVLSLLYFYTLRYLFMFLAYLVRITFGRLYRRAAAFLRRLYVRYLLNRANAKLSQLYSAAEKGFTDFSDHISIN